MTNLDKLAEIFPECITETEDADGNLIRAVDFDILRQILSGELIDGREAYEFNFVGKKRARLEAYKGIDKTLRPALGESRDFDSTENLYIEGDNLDALKLLAESYLGKVKMIYMDPPYNTGNDFIYRDDFAQDADDFDAAADNFYDAGNRLSANKKNCGRFHSDWCAMIYSRLLIAKYFLSNDGVIFISIDDHEQANLKKICDEIFGEKNFVAEFVWKKKQGGGNDSNFVIIEHEYILCFAKDIQNLKLGLDKKYKLDDNTYPFSDDKGDYGLITLDKSSIQFSKSLVFEIEDSEGNKYLPRVINGKQSCWRWSKQKVKSQFDELIFKNGKVYTKYYIPKGVTPKSLLIDSIYGRTASGNSDVKALFKNNPFNYPKPLALVQHFISIATDADSIVMDFFSGSATTAHAVMELNAEDGGRRKFIMIQLPEPAPEKSEARRAGFQTICEIGKERIRRAGDKLKADYPALDAGFRVFKVGSSNYKPLPKVWTQDTLDLYAENILPDRDAYDLLFGTLLETGLPIHLKFSEETIDGFKVLRYGENILACFEKNVPAELFRKLAGMEPKKILFRDASFRNSSDKINALEYFKYFAPNTIVKVL